MDLCITISYSGRDLHALPEDLHFPLYVAILYNLKDFAWYNAPVPKEFREIRYNYIWAFLNGLTHFTKPNDRLATLILCSWRLVFRWLRILTAEPGPDVVSVFLGGSSRSQIITNLLVALTSHPKTRTLVNEEEFLDFVLGCWENSTDEFEPEGNAALALIYCIIEGDNTVRRIKKMLGESSYKNFVDITLYRLYLAADHILDQPRMLDMDVWLWHAIMDDECGDNHALKYDGNGAFLQVLKRMRRVWKDGQGPEFSNQLRLVNSCLSALSKNFNSFVGREFMDAVKTALWNGILDVCLYLSAYAPLNPEGDEGNDFPLTFLRDYLPRLLVFPSFIKTIKIAISAIKKSSLACSISGHSAYREAWLDLQRLLLYRLMSSIYFDLNKPYYSCSSVCAVLVVTHSTDLTLSHRCGARKLAQKTYLLLVADATRDSTVHQNASERHGNCKVIGRCVVRLQKSLVCLGGYILASVS